MVQKRRGDQVQMQMTVHHRLASIQFKPPIANKTPAQKGLNSKPART
jgi:hypothetical protein